MEVIYSVTTCIIDCGLNPIPDYDTCIQRCWDSAASEELLGPEDETRATTEQDLAERARLTEWIMEIDGLRSKGEPADSMMVALCACLSEPLTGPFVRRARDVFVLNNVIDVLQNPIPDDELDRTRSIIAAFANDQYYTGTLSTFGRTTLLAFDTLLGDPGAPGLAQSLALDVDVEHVIGLICEFPPIGDSERADSFPVPGCESQE